MRDRGFSPDTSGDNAVAAHEMDLMSGLQICVLREHEHAIGRSNNLAGSLRQAEQSFDPQVFFILTIRNLICEGATCRLGSGPHHGRRGLC